MQGVQFERDGLPKLDNNALLNIIRVHWDAVFRMDGRRGPKQRGYISELIEWRHKLEGHRTQDVLKQDALDFVESVVAMLKCVDAKDQLSNRAYVIRYFDPAREVPGYSEKAPSGLMKYLITYAQVLRTRR